MTKNMIFIPPDFGEPREPARVGQIGETFQLTCGCGAVIAGGLWFEHSRALDWSLMSHIESGCLATTFNLKRWR
jgi:hypothetical protein